MDKSFSNGNGQSTYNGPGAQEFRQGWYIRPATIWDYLHPGIPW